jgi:hypothetical protein
MSTKSKEAKAPKEVKPKTETKGVEAVKSPDVPQASAEKEKAVEGYNQYKSDGVHFTPTPESTTTSQDDATERNDSIQSHSAQVTEGDAAQTRSEGIDLKEQPLDPHDGAQLDAANGEPVFDAKKEEKLAHAKAPEVPEHIKHAIVNPNGVGNEWPR